MYTEEVLHRLISTKKLNKKVRERRLSYNSSEEVQQKKWGVLKCTHMYVNFLGSKKLSYRLKCIKCSHKKSMKSGLKEVNFLGTKKLN